jgi:hypothetical protein
MCTYPSNSPRMKAPTGMMLDALQCVCCVVLVAKQHTTSCSLYCLWRLLQHSWRVQLPQLGPSGGPDPHRSVLRCGECTISACKAFSVACELRDYQLYMSQHRPCAAGRYCALLSVDCLGCSCRIAPGRLEALGMLQALTLLLCSGSACCLLQSVFWSSYGR